MNYLQQRTKQRKRRRFVSGSVIVVLTVLILGVYLYAPRGFTGTLHTLASPVWSAGSWTTGGVSSFGAFFTSKATLEKQNDELERQLDSARVELGQRAILESENRTFRSMWSRATSSDGVLAAVLTTPPQSPHDLIVLDAGEREGIAVNDRIIFGTVGLGYIQEVYADTSIARLYSTNDVETRGIIVGEDVSLVLIGEGGGSYRAEIPRDVPVSEGDILVLPDSRSLEFARVVEVRLDPTDSFQHIRARSPINITQLRWVQVIEHNEQRF
ncbi:MAG: rod shape-determining protein MreC [Candidatus Paceibacterota bacterium]